MKFLETFVIASVAIIHFYFMFLEMYLWTKPKGLKTFGLKKEFAEQSKTLASNQGLYNGFLASGIIWSLATNKVQTTLFFLLCVVIAGIYGSLSLKQSKIFYFQALPAIISIILIYIN